mmetsp:Transcript_28276/g.34940  ORF Transcript_28276/g.34940 Transcript_28276/m.34940 type:complete len:319 (+) Transcript_28276:169-1125(+)
MKSRYLLRSIRSYGTVKKELGFIGLGQMGSKMAKNLKSSGKYNVTVHDANKMTYDSLFQQDCQIAESIQHVGKYCETIISMLPSTPNVESAYKELFKGLEQNKSKEILLIDSSTIEPNATLDLAKKIETNFTHVKFVDAPVSGGVNGAAAGTLTFMVGGSKEAYDTSIPYLEIMGEHIVHCGSVSMGQVAKLCNNLALAIEMIGVSEAMTLGVKLGIDPKVLTNVMNTSSSQCWSYSKYNPYPGVMENVPASNDYEGGFSSALMRKDLGLALDAAKKIEANVPLTSNAFQLYNMVCTHGFASKDFGVILKMLRSEGGK